MGKGVINYLDSINHIELFKQKTIQFKIVWLDYLYI